MQIALSPLSLSTHIYQRARQQPSLILSIFLSQTRTQGRACTLAPSAVCGLSVAHVCPGATLICDAKIERQFARLLFLFGSPPPRERERSRRAHSFGVSRRFFGTFSRAMLFSSQRLGIGGRRVPAPL